MRSGAAFRLLWIGHALSTLGSRIIAVGSVFWVMRASDSAARAGVVSSVMLWCWAVSQLPAGWLADRFDRRLVMMVCDGAAVVAAVPLVVMALLGESWFPVLLASLMVRSLSFSARVRAESAALPQVVGAGRLVGALAFVQGRSFAAGLLGPLVAGGLFVVDASLVFIADLVLSSAAFVLLLPLNASLGGGGAGGDGAAPLAQMRIGFSVFWRQPYVRRTAVLGAGLSVAVSVVNLVVSVALLDEGVSPGLVGLVLGAGTAGGLLGALTVRRALDRLRGPRLPLVVPLVVSGLAAGVLALRSGAFLTAVAYAVFLFPTPIWQSAIDARTIAVVPAEVLGRVQASGMSIATLPAALAPLVGGLLYARVSGSVLLCATLLLLAVMVVSVGRARAFD
ncbi:hypothetical protein GCM10027589_15180 [Actinocorallia lasiicapitis]